MVNILNKTIAVNTNIDAIIDFLCFLGADENTPRHWQTYPEPRGNGGKTIHPFGSFTEHREKLIAANEHAALCVCVTDINGPRRNGDFALGCRFAILDLDGAPLPDWHAVGMPVPHLIIESSPDRWHCYWRLQDRLPKTAWIALQQKLAATFNGDPGMANPALVMRVPGSVHHKSGAFLTRIVSRHNYPPIGASVFITALANVNLARAESARIGEGGRGGVGGIIRDAGGKVIDGREAYATRLVHTAHVADPDATAEDLEATVWDEFCRTASLHSSQRFPSVDAIRRDIRGKVKYILRKNIRHAERAEATLPPWTPPAALDPETAQARLRAAILDHVRYHLPILTGVKEDGKALLKHYAPDAPQPRLVINATAGLGKSVTVIDVLTDIEIDASGDMNLLGCVWFVVATYALAAELAAKADALNLRAVAIRGRTYTSGPQDPPLCQRHEVVKELTSAGITNIKDCLCETKISEQNNGPASITLKCRYRDGCPYFKQFDEQANIFFLSHEYLFVRPTDRLPRPDYVVIDELPLNSFFTERHCTPEAILNTAHDATAVVTAALDDMRRGVDPREGLRLAEISASGLHAMSKAIRERPEYSMKNVATPDLADEIILRRIAKRKIPWAARFIDAVARELNFERERVAGVQWQHREYEEEDTRVVKDWIEFQHPTTFMIKHSTPMLMLDGTANRTLVDEFFTDHERHSGDDELSPEELAWRRGFGFVEIEARRSARVTQITNFHASKRRLMAHVAKGAPARYADKYLPIIFERLPKDEHILFVTYKAVEEYILESEHLRALVPDNITLTHFGAIRGRDEWKDVAGVVILGRNLPPAGDVERIALALRAGRDVPLPGATGYERTAIRWHAKDGRGGVTHDWRHPDPLVEAIRWSVCDGETMQAADRARLVWPDGSKWVLLISGTPTLAADEFVPWERWLGLSPDPLARFGEVLVRDRGAAILSGGNLAARHPDLFPTAGAARVGIHRLTKNAPTEVPTGIAGVAVPVTLMRGKVLGERGAMAPTLTTLPGRLTAVKISRDAGADAWVEEPQPPPEDRQPGAAPNRGPRHWVMRADPVEVEIPATDADREPDR